MNNEVNYMDMIAKRSSGEWFSSMPRTEDIYRIIDEAQNDGRPKYRIGAVIALGNSGDPRAVRILMDCCTDENPDIRKYATEALGKLKSGRSVATLIERLGDKAELSETRIHAAEALATIRSNRAIEALRERSLDSDENPAIRSCCADAFAR
jgi:HEAT repeat protein